MGASDPANGVVSSPFYVSFKTYSHSISFTGMSSFYFNAINWNIPYISTASTNWAPGMTPQELEDEIPEFLKCALCNGRGVDEWADSRGNFHETECSGCSGRGIQPVPWEEIQ